jgi:outer membrane protein TolC
MARAELLKKEALKIAKIKIEVEIYNYKKELADCYTNLIGSQKIFKLRNEDLFVQKIACDVAEKEYREGVIKIAEYARQRNAMTNSLAAQEDAKKVYINCFERLQVILGVKFNKIRRQG